MALYTWTGGGDRRSFTDPHNWAAGVAPSANDTAEFTSALYGETVNGQGQSVGQVDIDFANTLSLYGAINVANSINLSDASDLFASGAGTTVSTNLLNMGQGSLVCFTDHASLDAQVQLGGMLLIDDTATVSADSVVNVSRTYLPSIIGIADDTGLGSQIVTFDAPINGSDGELDLESDGHSVLNVTGSLTGNRELVDIVKGTVDLGQATLSVFAIGVESGATLCFSPTAGATGAIQSFNGVKQFVNLGEVIARNGIVLDLSATTTNLSGGTLGGGTWYAKDSRIVFGDLAITKLASHVILSGSGSEIEATVRVSPTNSTGSTLEDSLTTVGSGGLLQLDERTLISSSSGIELQNGARIVVSAAELQQSGSGVTLDLGSRLQGDGRIDATLAAQAGSMIVTGAADALVLAGSGSTLASRINGAGTVQFDGGSSTLAAGVVLQAGGLDLENGTTVTLGTNLSYHNALTVASSTLDLSNRTLSLAGALTMQDAVIEDYNGLVRLGATASLQNSGFSQIDGDLLNNGTVSNSEQLRVSGRVNGTGTFDLSTGGRFTSLSFGAGVTAGQTIDFGGDGHGMVTLDAPGLFRGTIAHFGAGDTIDLGGFSSVGAKYSYTENAALTGGLMRLASGSSRAVISFDGDLVASGFQVGADENGGTTISYNPLPQQGPTLAQTA